MKATFVYLAPLVAAYPSDIYADWHAPGPNDARGPCPMLNTLANHGFLPRNGLNFTRNAAIKAFEDSLNFDPEFGSILFEQGLRRNLHPNPTFFDLDLLSVHNVLEKDASLSRTDAYFGDQRKFNETIFNETKSWWTSDSLDVNMLANSRIGRQLSSRRDNPTYTFTNNADGFSFGELASLILVFGDRKKLTADRKLVEYFFENERLPTELGWTRPARVLRGTMHPLQDSVRNATTLLTEPGKAND